MELDGENLIDVAISAAENFNQNLKYKSKWISKPYSVRDIVPIPPQKPNLPSHLAQTAPQFFFQDYGYFK